MEHPLIPNLSEKTTDELQKSIGELQHKLGIAMRTGNGHLCQQIRMALESYQGAYRSKLSEEAKRYEESEALNLDKIKIS